MKVNDKDPKQSGDRSARREQKKSLRRLGKRIQDKIWWVSLDDHQRIIVLNRYNNTIMSTSWAGQRFIFEHFEINTKKDIHNKKEERNRKIDELLK